MAKAVEKGVKDRLYRACWVLPVTSPPIENGAVVVREGIIQEVGRLRDVSSRHTNVETRDLGDSVLLPGLVNAHTHLDNSAFKGKTPRGGGQFTAWIDAALRAKDSLTSEARRAAAEKECPGLAETGAIAVGDISPTGTSPALLADQPLWAVVFIEVTGVGGARAEENYRNAVELLHQTAEAGDRIRVSLSPHAPYSTSAELIHRIHRENSVSDRLTSIHVAESREEVEYLTGQSDAFRELKQRWGYYDPEWRPPGRRPVGYLNEIGCLAPGTIAVHCVQLDDEEIELLVACGCSVCLCPRSNDYIGVGQPRLTEMLDSGIQPCLGTDGLGSVPSLSLFDEMAFVREAHSGVEPDVVLRMASINGAKVLRLDSLLGSLETGKVGRFLAYSGEVGNEPVGAVTSGIDHERLFWVGDDIE